MKFVIICLFLVCSVMTSALATDDNFIPDAIFGEKKVLCSIDFMPDSYTLSTPAKLILDGVVAELEKVDTDTNIIRIEGFWGGEDTLVESPRLSMKRALAVEEYFSLHHKVSFERYLTGHNISGETGSQVKIFIYKNPWHMEDAPVQLANRGNVNGSS